jgi:hypothetical protein
MAYQQSCELHPHPDLLRIERAHMLSELDESRTVSEVGVKEPPAGERSHGLRVFADNLLELMQILSVHDLLVYGA